jgi:hypothetical protein
MVKLNPIKPKKKKAVSAIVGYVLLVTLGIVMAGIVYGYLKTYVPKDALQCPDGTSLFLKDYQCANGSLNVTLKNNGRFFLAGFSIHGANDTNQKIATINLVAGFINSSDKQARNIQDSYILFNLVANNTMSPGYDATYYFNYTQTPKILELTPVRFETYNNKERFAVCGNAKTTQEITCG